MKESRRLADLKQSILSVSVSPDGSEAACATGICDVVFCRLKTEGSPEPVEHLGGTVQYSPNGIVFASSIDERLFISDVRTGKFLRRITWHNNAVLDMAFSPDGTRLASGGREELVICNTATAMPVRKFEVSGIISGIRYTPDVNRLVTSNQDSTVSVWDCETAERVRLLTGHAGKARCVAVSPDGSRILSGGGDKQLILWDMETGECLRKFDCGAAIWSVDFTPDGRHAFCGGYNRVMLWDLDNGESLGQHDEVINGYFWVAMLPSGKQAVSGSMKGCFRLWDLYG